MFTTMNSTDSSSPITYYGLHHPGYASNSSSIFLASIIVQNIAGMEPTKLNQQNYITWHSFFMFVLKRYKFFGIVNEDDICPFERVSLIYLDLTFLIPLMRSGANVIKF